MLNHQKGNLIDMAEEGLFDVIIHGANCQNTMGSGIAKEIRARYPEAYAADCRASNFGHNSLGEFSYAKVIKWKNQQVVTPFFIVNAYTQYHYLPRGVDHFSYDTFLPCLQKIATEFPSSRVGLPYIGMGLAGGDSKRILSIIETAVHYFKYFDSELTLVEFA